MILQDWPFSRSSGKDFVCIPTWRALAAGLILLAALPLAGCSVNPATGKTQFTALMSADEERAIGARENPRILATFGGAFSDRALEDRIRAIGEKLAAAAFPEGKGQDCCRFFILDTPMVNAFATPGGYIYVTRGVLALTNDESEAAAVLAHEIGHIAARHAAERYSHGAVSGIAAAVVAVAANAPGLADGAAGVGSDLYTRSWSQAQESEADALGLKYLAAAGYAPEAMADVLDNIERFSAQEQKGSAAAQQEPGYFSTHPRTGDRVAQARREAISDGHGKQMDRDGKARAAWLAALEGLVWGESAAQGFVRGRDFFHPAGDFAFTAPEGFRLVNRSDEVAILGSGGAVAIFDAVADGTGASPEDYLTGQWMKDEALENLRTITISGRPAATASFAGTVDGNPATVRLVAVSWALGRIYRFQISIPEKDSPALLEGLRRMTYSLRPLTPADRTRARVRKIHVVVAQAGDTAQSLSAAMGFVDRPLETFAVLNGLPLPAAAPLVPGRSYKIVVEGR